MSTELHDGTTWIKEVISLRKIVCFRQKHTICQTILTRELKDRLQGTINAKNLRKTRFSPSEGGLACSEGGYSSLALH